MTSTGSVVAESEAEIRARLGVPAGAERVMVVTESSHWDPNWLLTSKEYFRLCVRRSLDHAIDALLAEPRRVYSLECAFFPDMYLRHRRTRQGAFRDLVNEGRLRFTGSGVTTPDTLLPEDEILLRDLLIGQQWLRSRGMTQEPRVLYLPDSFGHSPGVPSLLAAAGVPYATVCRIDGMRFPGEDMESASHYPRAGSSAELLLDVGTADFVWRGPDGSEALTHWQPYTYGHGDMIASGGLSRALGLPVAWPDRRESHVTGRIDRYIDQLSKVGRTPYLLLAIGFDFVQPVPRLVELLDRWNDTQYQRTGVWLVNAGLDDYLDLVSHHRDELPMLELDPNPYWMGFYASRPVVKAACRDLGRRLIAADNEQARILVAEQDPTALVSGLVSERHAAAWWTAVTSNHHDYITGTSPDRVAHGEQMGWLRTALAATAPADTPGGVTPPPGGRSGERDTDGPQRWSRTGTRVTVTTDALTAVFDERRGGALVSLIDGSGAERLDGPSLELRSYAESGGLWRMGHEFQGGRWARRDATSQHRGEVSVADDTDRIRVAIQATLEGRPATIVVELGADDPTLLVRTTVTAPNRRTVTLAVQQRSPIESLAMHQPGCMVTRPLQRWYSPTFWPLHSFAAALPIPADEESLPALVLATGVSTALHAAASGAVETVVARTAVKELAYGIVPVLAPAWGRTWGTQTGDLALRWIDEPRQAVVIEAGRDLARLVDRAAGRLPPWWLVETDEPLVEVTTVKAAHRGHGVIVRLRHWGPMGPPRPVRLTLAAGTGAAIAEAWQADSLERDLAPLIVEGGVALLAIGQHLTTVRLAVSPGRRAL